MDNIYLIKHAVHFDGKSNNCPITVWSVPPI